MPVPVTALFASILALVMVYLGLRVSMQRGKQKIMIGDGGNSELFLEGRRHLNFVEHVPMAVILMGLVELNGAPKLWLYILGSALVLARVLHPIGLRATGIHAFRPIGALLTILTTVALIVIALQQVFSRGLP